MLRCVIISGHGSSHYFEETEAEGKGSENTDAVSSIATLKVDVRSWVEYQQLMICSTLLDIFEK